MKALLLFVLYIFACSSLATAFHVDLCRLLKNGTQFLRPGSCDEYITCVGATGLIQKCPDSTSYDRESKKCVDKATDCNVNVCSGVNGKWVSNPNNCQEFFYCLNSVAYPGSCDIGFHFDQSSQKCNYQEDSTCDEVPDICRFASKDTKVRDENDCAYYYDCKSGTKKRTACSKKYFNVDLQACDEKLNVPCSAHPKPSKVCGTAKSPKSGFRPDGWSCRGYFYCQNLGGAHDLDPAWGQCPEGFFLGTNACVDPKTVVCTYDRCDGRGNMMVTASTNNCRDYLICENGITVEKRTCSGDKFFDEDIQACVNYVIKHKCCDGRK